MTLNDLCRCDKIEPLFVPEPEAEIRSGYTSDLLSDVMARAQRDCVLITIQAHRNTIAVCAMVGARAVLICNQRDIPDEMLEAAREDGIAVLRTRDNQFKTSCNVHACLTGG